jgi:heme-degrading monooxygenase HmoA
MSAVHVRIFEYDVAPAQADGFAAAYGAEGDWARLFARGHGYLGTELFRCVPAGSRWITVDRWTDEAAWQAFLDAWGTEYAALDRRLHGLAAGGRLLLEGWSADPD